MISQTSDPSPARAFRAFLDKKKKIIDKKFSFQALTVKHGTNGA